jgi:hypothetical protein
MEYIYGKETKEKKQRRLAKTKHKQKTNKKF